MSRWKHAGAHGGSSFGPLVLDGVLAIITAAIISPLLWLPLSLALPAFSAMAIIAAAVLALIAWWSGAEHRGGRVTLWDLAGACVLIGIAAAVFSRPEQTVTLFGLSQ